MVKNIEGIYSNIRSIRILKDISQEHMAEKMGVSQSSYGKLERGATNVTWRKLQKIAEIFGVSEWDIVNFGQTPDTPSFMQPSRPELDSRINSASQMLNSTQLLNKVEHLEEVNRMLTKQLADKDEIIALLKV